jgi:hypothetical protein
VKKQSRDGKREAEGTNQCLFECIVPDQNPSHATHIPYTTSKQLRNLLVRGKGGECLSNIFLRMVFFGYRFLKREKYKLAIFSKRLFGWCKDRRKLKNPFYGTQNRGL